jgi:hypothetical protein
MGLKSDKNVAECCATKPCSIAAKPTENVRKTLATVSEIHSKPKEKAKDPEVASLGATKKKLTAMPTPETAKATAQKAASNEDVQNKIAALQRQLSELARNKA